MDAATLITTVPMKLLGKCFEISLLGGSRSAKLNKHVSHEHNF